ncbi:MAG: ROK family protein [Cyanobacteria bacterium P01_A01_bin.84]
MATLTQVIGIDLGGTAIKLGLFDVSGTCLKSLTVPTPQPSIPKSVIEVMLNAISQLEPEKKAMTQSGSRGASAIGIGMPGPADLQGRLAKISINLDGWVDVPLADVIESHTGKPTAIANDANCAGLGEAWLGAGRQFQNLFLLTLGTGVGGAIILDGKLFTGHQGAAGELGLMTLYPNGPLCNSGNYGSLEQYLCINAIIRRTGKTPLELWELADKGDRAALNFWQEYGRDLGIGLTSLIYVLAPQAIIIGGGISASAKFFVPSAKAEVEKRVMPTSRPNLKILPAQLGNSAGMLGAAKLAIALLKKQAGKY